jgi:hypothetical protein
MKKTAMAVCSAVIVVLAVPGVASAGEVAGPPGPGGAEGAPTPVADFWTGGGAASICSFSGLNDEITTEGEMPEPTRTQSYGTFLVLVRNTAGVDTPTAKAILGESPADSCNPNRAPFGNPKG